MNSGSLKLNPVVFPPRPCEAADEPLANRVGTNQKDDRDRPAGVLCRPDRIIALDQDDLHLEADELGRQRGQSLTLPLRKAVL